MDKLKKMESIIAMITGFLVLHLIFHSKALLIVALAIGVITVVSDYLSDKLYWLWMKIALILGWVNSKIILSAIFFFILTPIAFLYKLKGKNSLNIKRNSNASSYYIDRNYEYSKKDLEEMF